MSGERDDREKAREIFEWAIASMRLSFEQMSEQAGPAPRDAEERIGLPEEAEERKSVARLEEELEVVQNDLRLSRASLEMLEEELRTRDVSSLAVGRKIGELEQTSLSRLLSLQTMRSECERLRAEGANYKQRVAKLEKELEESRQQVFGLMALSVEVAARTEAELADLRTDGDKEIASLKASFDRTIERVQEDGKIQFDRRLEAERQSEARARSWQYEAEMRTACLKEIDRLQEVCALAMSTGFEECERLRGELQVARGGSTSYTSQEFEEMMAAHAREQHRLWTERDAFKRDAVSASDGLYRACVDLRDARVARDKAALEARENAEAAHKAKQEVARLFGELCETRMWVGLAMVVGLRACDALRAEASNPPGASTAAWRPGAGKCKHPCLRFGSSGWVVFCVDCEAHWHATEDARDACMSSPETEGDRLRMASRCGPEREMSRRS